MKKITLRKSVSGCAIGAILLVLLAPGISRGQMT